VSAVALVLISSFVREKDGPVLSCTGPIALADDAQFAVAACPRRDNQVVSLIDESLRDFCRSLRVTLASRREGIITIASSNETLIDPSAFDERRATHEQIVAL
jgi:hypothetical protein